MARIMLDDCIIDHSECERHSRILWDHEVWGFGCRIRPSGKAEFIAYFHTTGGLRRVVPLGSFDSLTTAQARGIAREIIGRNDPSAHSRGFEHLAPERQIRAI